MAFAATAITSCSDREDDIVSTENSDFSEEQIEKVAYGCGAYADWDETDEKVETTATEEYVAMLKERLATERKASGIKSTALEQMVGVVKDKTCGKYDEVRIYYDCQDHSANDTYSHGFKGSWKVTQNITMYFCLVPARLFHNTGDYYGVMNFSSDFHFVNDWNLKKVGRIDGFMDAEDSKCGSAMYYTKHGQKEVNVLYSSFVSNTKLVGNGNLYFEMFAFAADDPSNGYPDLGFDYGVFGMFNYKKDWDENQGKVHSDDEDSHNANNATFTYQGKEQKINGSFHWVIVTVGKNTDFQIARIRTKNRTAL